MRKSVLCMMAIMCMGITACGKTTVAETTTTTESVSENPIINMDITASKLTYEKFEVLEDDGEPILRVYFTYTNKVDEDSCAMNDYYINAYQNKLECDTALLSDDNEASDNMTRGVLKDGSLEVAEEFKLDDKTSPVTLSVEPCFDDDFDEQKMIIDITQGQ